MSEELTPDLRRRLRVLADTLPMLEAPDFVAGHWHDSEHRPDGTWSMPWFELAPGGQAFIRAVGESGSIVIGFDWMTWASTPEAVALRDDRVALANATPDQLGRLLTMVIRSDRFYEGALDHAFETGLMAAIARRAKVLSD